MATYLYTTLLANVMDSGLYTNVTSTTPIRNIINRGARKVISDLDLRTTKRLSSVSKFFDDVYTYTCPTDLKGNAIVDIIPQGERDTNTSFFLATPERFDRKKSLYTNMVAVSDYDFVRKLKVSIDVNEESEVVSEFSSLTQDSGTWTAFSADSDTLAVDSSNYVTGSSSLSWNINATGGTTAGVYINGINAIDITDYITDGSALVWAYITSTTNLTNYKLRIGSSDANYYELTTTTQADGTAFVAGWNLLKLNFSSKTTTGTPDLDATDYIALYMTKAGAKVSETGYRFDSLQLHSGWYNQVLYYSEFPWQTNANVWIAESTADTDYINANTDELDLFTEACRIEVYRDLKEYDQMKLAQAEYTRLSNNYKLKYPSERLKMEQNYW